MHCIHYLNGDCRSCEWLEIPYSEQLEQKTEALKRLLSPYFLQNTAILPSIGSAEKHFRNKAKMVVSGSVECPILGILKNPSDPYSAIDLADCLLYPESFSPLFPILRDFIGRAGLVPYNIAKKRGELKYILITESQYNQSVMLRFVLKSEAKRPLVERELPALLEKLPPHSVVSLNIQPQHAAVLEGEQEIFLTPEQTLEEHFNGIPLFIRPQGFFQTNPQIAAQLYATAQNWVADLPITHLWDLFCGAGGFGLHCAYQLQKQQGYISLTGIEISPSAIACAQKSAEKLGLADIEFASLDSATFALNTTSPRPDLIIMNPPRRGIGKSLAEFLNQLGAPYLLYSSCNAKSMATDFACLTSYQIAKVQLFDMFPHTEHYEVLTLLVRKVL